MNVEELREHCLSLPHTVEAMPFAQSPTRRTLIYDSLVTYSIGGKWYVIADIEKKFINIKCQPDLIPQLIERYNGAFPAWHMNKKYWISIRLDSDMPDTVISQLIDSSYDIVARSLKKSIRAELGLICADFLGKVSKNLVI